MSFDPAADGWVPCSVGPFMTSLGTIWRKGEGEAIRFGMLAERRHGNHRDIVHGGVIMTLADFGLGSIMSELNGNNHQVTVQLDVQFLSAGEVGDFLVSEGEVLRRSSSLFFVRGTIFALGTDPLRRVAAANGVWKTVRPLPAPVEKS